MTDAVTLIVDSRQLCKLDRALQAKHIEDELAAALQAKLHTVADRLRDDLVCDNEEKRHTLTFCQFSKMLAKNKKPKLLRHDMMYMMRQFWFVCCCLAQEIAVDCPPQARTVL